MNIIFKDAMLFEQLKNIAVHKEIIGSRMYGLDDKESDSDYLYILPFESSITNDLFKTHHQLQYKKDNEDHVFVFLDTFLKNIFKGDSTINFEVLHEIKEGSQLGWLTKYKEHLNVYTIIRAYLGLAKRDVKYFPFREKNLRTKRKQVKHIYRSLISAKMIYEKNFSVKSFLKDSKFKEIDKFKRDIDFKVELTKLVKQTTSLRDQINKALDKKEVSYFLPIEIQKQLADDYLNFITKSDISFSHLREEIMTYYYDVNVNGLNY